MRTSTSGALGHLLAGRRDYTAGVHLRAYVPFALFILMAACVARTTQAPQEGFAAQAVPAYLYAGGQSGEIQVFKLDRISGRLAAHGSFPTGRTEALVADPRGRFLYAASDGEVTAFAIRARN